MSNKPSNLRVVSEDPKHRWFSVQFDGNSNYNNYDLQVRLKQDSPIDDDPWGRVEFVPNPDGGKWSPKHKGWSKDAQGNRIWGSNQTVGVRRTWTSYGGSDRGTGLRRTQANKPIQVIVSELDGKGIGPWQLIVIDNLDYHPTAKQGSRTLMIEWPKEVKDELRTESVKRISEVKPAIKDVAKGVQTESEPKSKTNTSGTSSTNKPIESKTQWLTDVEKSTLTKKERRQLRKKRRKAKRDKR